MLILEIAAGVFLGALAFQHRAQLLPYIAGLFYIAVAIVGGLVYFAFTTPEQRTRHFQSAVAWVGLVVVVILASLAPQWVGADRWARWNARWEAMSSWQRVAIPIGFVVALIVLGVVVVLGADWARR